MDTQCKILIVDDEYLLRQGIKHLLDWKKEGFEIVGEASNGREALDLIDTLKPHIVISDMVMPVMDGLELVSIIKENYPEIQIVILSGYSDFDYVKGTFKLGVTDYILKPKLNPDEVLQLLKNIAGNIPNLVISNSENGPDIRNKLSKLAAGFDTDLKAISDFFNYDSYILIGTDMKRIYDSHFKQISSLNNFLSKKTGIFFNSFIHYELDINKDIFAVLINFQKENYLEVLNCLNSMILDIIPKCSGIYFAQSNIFNSLKNLKDYYNNNFKTLLSYKFYLKENRIISYNEIHKAPYKEKFDFKYYSQKLYVLDTSSALNYLKQYISNCILHYSVNEFDLKTLLQNAIYNIINILDELHFDVKDINASKIEYFQRIDSVKYAEDLLDVLDSIENDITIVLNNKEHPVTNETINKITKYISNHYNEQLTLKDIADKFHFNYYYLSSYFSSQIAEGFSDYLNKIRVEKALELLENEDIPVSEISYLIGYSDHSYFCKVFKKFTKVTPSKFRKNIMSRRRGDYE